MKTITTGTALAVLLLAIAGCTPALPGESSPAPSVSSTPVATESAPAAADPELPTCEDFYPETTTAALLDEGMELLGDVSTPGGGGYGASDPALQATMEGAALSRSCTWVLPASERGLTTSVTFISEADRAAIAAVLDAAGYTYSDSGVEYWSRATDGVSEMLESESHAIDGAIWVATWEGFGDTAPQLTEQALDAARALNP